MHSPLTLTPTQAYALGTKKHTCINNSWRLMVMNYSLYVSTLYWYSQQRVLCECVVFVITTWRSHVIVNFTEYSLVICKFHECCSLHNTLTILPYPRASAKVTSPTFLSAANRFSILSSVDIFWSFSPIRRSLNVLTFPRFLYSTNSVDFLCVVKST